MKYHCTGNGGSSAFIDDRAILILQDLLCERTDQDRQYDEHTSKCLPRAVTMAKKAQSTLWTYSTYIN
jgi:hypothetical protein